MIQNRRTMTALCGLLLLSGCASPETRLRTGLTEAGMAPGVAACMAERMVDRLSLAQLRRVGRIGNVLKSDDLRQMSLETFLNRTRALDDPEILTVATSSAALCAVGLG